MMLDQPQPRRLHGILPSKPRFSALSFRLQSPLLCCGGLVPKAIEDATQPIFKGPSHPVGGQLCGAGLVARLHQQQRSGCALMEELRGCSPHETQVD
jgi:hypothetical protein